MPTTYLPKIGVKTLCPSLLQARLAQTHRLARHRSHAAGISMTWDGVTI